jgi:Asp-tRNA(Asn)/Glu-tRNA(Gln) amidotransferase A subunit family amidase
VTERTQIQREATGFFHGRSLAELGEALRTGGCSAVELAEAALESIDRLDGRLNAFVSVDRDGALRAARAADADLAEGRDHGPLHGIPVGIKDVIDVEGGATTMGSAHFAAHVSTSDAACVRRLRDGGAVPLGKTTTQEFAFGPTGDIAHNGPARNPHHPERMTGGSSAGSAAAVAAGLVPVALGTDTGGSVRIPAALCGTTGFKPAYGAIPTDGVFPLSSSLDHVGVLTADPADARLAYRVLAGLRPMPNREHGAHARIGWIPPDLLHPTDPQVTRTTREALAGKDVREVRPREIATMQRGFTAIQFSEAYAVHAERIAEAPQHYTGDVLAILRQAAQTAGWRYVRGLAEREAWRAELTGLLHEVEVLALPTTCVTAPEIGQREVDLDGVPKPVRGALIGLTSPFNLAGAPSVTVPAGAVDGLPVGLQLVGRPGHEDRLLAVAGRLAR